MTNKYCNLVATNLIKDEFTKINDGFSSVEADKGVQDARMQGHVDGAAEKHAASQITHDPTGKTKITAVTVQAALDQVEAEINAFIGVNANAEVGSAHISAVKAKTFTDLDARIEESEQDLVSYKADNTTQLASKADKTYADTQLFLKRDKTTLIPLTDFADDAKMAIAGTASIYPSFADKSVTPIRTSFFTTGKNLFDKATINSGKYVSQADGILYANASYHASDYVYVLPNTQYTLNKDCRVAYYDSAKTFISGIYPATGTVTFTTPATCMYVRFSFAIVSLNTAQMELGAVVTSYKSFSQYIPIALIEAVPLPSLGLDYKNTDFITTGKNLFNKTTATDNFYVDSATGLLVSNASFAVSDFIPVSASIAHIKNSDYSIAYYDSSKVYISGQSAAGAFTTPANTAYIRVSLYKSGVNVDAFQVEIGSVITSYDPFSYFFKQTNNNSVMGIVNLPPTIPALVGKEINIYFDNVIDKSKNYDFDVVCTKGIQQNERWTWVPDVAGTFALTLNIYQNFVLFRTMTTSIVVKAIAVGSAVTKKMLCIGDSTTAAGVYTGEIINLFGADVMDITLLGAQGAGSNHWEGFGGWSAYTFAHTPSLTINTNPFWNTGTGAFDFAWYMSQHAYTGVDYVTIHLGINDIFNFVTDATASGGFATILADLDIMVNSIKAYDANVKIGVMVTIPPSANQEGFGSYYGSGNSLWRYRRTYDMWLQAFLAYYKGKEAQGIYLVPINVNLDTVHNMPSTSVAANSRSAVMVTRQTNSVHPDTPGYNQMADVLYYWLKGFES
jgi:lysophospholipase L1-like esterase